jgi:hypothetical protein
LKRLPCVFLVPRIEFLNYIMGQKAERRDSFSPATWLRWAVLAEFSCTRSCSRLAEPSPPFHLTFRSFPEPISPSPCSLIISANAFNKHRRSVSCSVFDGSISPSPHFRGPKCACLVRCSNRKLTSCDSEISTQILIGECVSGLCEIDLVPF